jgi:hypothetical protein
LHSNAHTVQELTVGLIVGVCPQLLLMKYWL